MKTFEWSQIPPIPGFSCLKMKEKAQEKIARDTQGMSPESVLNYFREASKRFSLSRLNMYPAPPRSSTLAVRETGAEPKRLRHAKNPTRKKPKL